MLIFLSFFFTAILCKIFKSYRQQAIWYTVAVYKSTVPTRSARCKEVFHDVTSSSSNNASAGNFKAFISHSLELTEILLNISNHRCSGSKLSMRKDFPAFIRMLKQPWALISVFYRTCPNCIWYSLHFRFFITFVAINVALLQPLLGAKTSHGGP